MTSSSNKLSTKKGVGEKKKEKSGNKISGFSKVLKPQTREKEKRLSNGSARSKKKKKRKGEIKQGENPGFLHLEENPKNLPNVRAGPLKKRGGGETTASQSRRGKYRPF